MATVNHHLSKTQSRQWKYYYGRRTVAAIELLKSQLDAVYGGQTDHFYAFTLEYVNVLDLT